LERGRKNWKTSVLFLVVLWLTLLIASVTILSSVVTPFLRSLQTQNLVSLDWAGYSVASNNLFPQPLVSNVSGFWTIPTVTVSSLNAYSAAWVGVGGLNDESLIQAGSEHDSVNGKAVYSLWYELLPNNAITIPDIIVSPGDEITASVSLVDSYSNTWSIKIQDVTTGQVFSRDFVYNSSRLTAEWVIERPTVNNRLTNLADFGSITFTDAKAGIDTTYETIGKYSNYVILMEDRQNNQLVTVSDLSRDGSSFTITFR
jgi:hypothetical protein